MRLYGEIVQRWERDEGKRWLTCYQWEISYKDYREDGSLKQTGTEDFGRERWNNEIRQAFVWTWDGKKRNKGGHRWFECVGYITYRRSEVKEVKEYMKRKYNAELVELR